ncbi:hypothetical protein IMSAGC014_00104 [Bacteroidaceae bacterium]|uniref:DUF805 domain-containing protein n=1 Tax=Prevotella sp. MGM2 TaxID=2033406 RepID=UPI000D0C187E|nr:DUF805 domain-containing protein [Prevotella sp. MGM2]GAY29487.1 DUF805 domain-containing protein [Prevotella sp. MGM2]GFI33621.1 hypothetical protein IMSAGC014_00104 [Bacteroidaceae bacterium]
MKQNNCPECGYPLNGTENMCPECGCPIVTNTTSETSFDTTQQPLTSTQNTDEYKTVSELFWSCEFYKVFKGRKFDLAQRIYECFEFWWECVKVWWHIFKTKFATFHGRASRREYFSFVGFPFYNPFFFLSLCLVIGFIPWLGVSVRRMHDINRSGWWVLCPIANIFFLFKDSDKSENSYGSPNPFKYQR